MPSPWILYYLLRSTTSTFLLFIPLPFFPLLPGRLCREPASPFVIWSSSTCGLLPSCFFKVIPFSGKLLLPDGMAVMLASPSFFALLVGALKPSRVMNGRLRRYVVHSDRFPVALTFNRTTTLLVPQQIYSFPLFYPLRLV